MRYCILTKNLGRILSARQNTSAGKNFYLHVGDLSVPAVTYLVLHQVRALHTGYACEVFPARVGTFVER